MSFISIIILIVFLVAALILVRRLKKRAPKMNRYRAYQAKQFSPKDRPLKKGRNRYSKPPRHEPELEHQPVEIEEAPPPKIKMSKAEKKALINLAESVDDPDVVLGLRESPRPDREKPIPTEAQIMLKPPPPPPPLTTFHVMAEEERPYSGYELLQAILSVGMRFGKHQIFHRHETKTGTGPILFSLSSAVSPGSFDLQRMGGFSKPGLSLFFTADQGDDPIEIYELMLQVAGQFIEDLGGHVLDENRDLLTPQKVVQQRQRLRQYVEAQQVPDLFEQIVEE